MFKGVDDPNLPKHVREMAVSMRSQWVAHYNEAWTRTKGKDDNKAKKAMESADAIHNRVKDELGLDDQGEDVFEADSGDSGSGSSSTTYIGKHKSYPITGPDSIRKAARAIGRAGPDNYTPQQLKRRIIAAAKRMGAAYVAQLPKSWKTESGAKEEFDRSTASEALLSEWDWDDDDCAVPSDPGADPLQAVPTRVAAQLPAEAQTMYLQAYNMCALMGGSTWQCDSVGWKAVDAGGYAPEDLPKYVKVGEQTEGEMLSLFTEASESGGSGSVWDVVLIKAGMSANRRFYTESCLRDAVSLFENSKAYADHPTADQLRQRSGNRSVTEIVGWYSDVHYQESTKSLVAKFHVLESAAWLRSVLLEMASSGVPNLIGLSINATGTQVRKSDSVGSYMEVTSLTSVQSTDVVTEPAAGGAVVRLVASIQSQEENLMDRAKIVAALAKLDAGGRKTFLESLELSDEERTAISEEVEKVAPAPKTTPVVEQKTEPVVPAVATVPAVDPAQVTSLLESVKALQMDSIKSYVGMKLAESKMPAHLKENTGKKIASILERRLMDAAEVDVEIKEAHDLWSAFENHSGSGAVRGIPQLQNMKEGADSHDRMILAIDGMLQNKNLKDEDGNTVPRFMSIKEAIARWTGRDGFALDAMAMMRETMTGFDSGIHGDKLLESMTTASWGSVFADRLWRRMVQEYQLPYLDDWKKVVSNIETITDFRTQRRDRIGGYGSTLATVAEQATYPQLTSPTDEEATYAIVKRGGLDDITIEMIANDDLRNIRNIPVKLARVAKQTLFRFVFDMVCTNGFSTNIYDAHALYDTTNHANIPGGASALTLSDNGLSVGWQQMRSQTAFNSALDILATRPKYLIVPTALEQLAWKLANSMVTILSANYNATEPNFFDKKLEVIVVDYLSDTNNWFLVGDPTTIPTIEMGFFNGNEEPELFVQDQPNVGAVMTADKITYKIRHIYSGAILDYRGFQGANP